MEILTNQNYAFVTLLAGALFYFFLRHERGRIGQLVADVTLVVGTAGAVWTVIALALPYIPFVK
jgi:membrane associated rhomboid family serine protease